MSITTDPLEQIARTGWESLNTIRQRLENKESLSREELLRMVRDAIKEIEDIDFNNQSDSYYFYRKE